MAGQRKKVVFLPYDMDTALGINNEGELDQEYDYAKEDTDHLISGANVFNGQDSVLWNNVREAFGDELAAIYGAARSNSLFSYDGVEAAFENHQSKWPEGLLNADSRFKYLDPLFLDNNKAYLHMLQGTKVQQRRWWLSNRFKYMDSKYNVGEARSTYITLRCYAKSDISVTPYMDVYATVKYGSYLVQQRAQRNQTYTLACPIDRLNDTEVYIYSCDMLKDVGDLSGLKVGYADFSMATKLQRLKLGDSDPSYSNGNLKTVDMGNNTLLRYFDVRNSNALANPVNLSGCTNIEEVYCDGTALTNVVLPNGGILKKLHLPATMANLTIRNQTQITEFVMPSYANLTTLRLENVSSVVDPIAIVNAINTGSRVRLIGFYWDAETYSAVDAFYTKLDSMRGLDEAGNNTEKAQVLGTIHVDGITGAQLASLQERYPDVTITYDSITSYVYYHDWEGNLISNATEEVRNGADATYSGRPSHASTEQYSFEFIGWARSAKQTTADANAQKAITADRHLYAAYKLTTRTYTAYFVRASADGGDTLKTQTNVPYGTNPTPPSNVTSARGSDYTFSGWSPAVSGITRDTTYTAVFIEPSRFVNPGFDVSDTYAVQWDYSDSAVKLHRGGLAASLSDPAPATSLTGSGSSDFDSIAPWSGMKRFNVVNGAMVADTDASFSETDNDTVVYIPEFYYKSEKDTENNRWTWAISPTAKTGYSKHPGSGRYVGRFHTSGGSSGVFSKGGVAPLANVTRANFRTYSHNKGEKWRQIDLATWSAIQLLYLVEFANWNSQTVLGGGQNSGSVKNTGMTTGAAYHTLKGSGASGNMYRWIENPFSNLLTWVDGFVASERATYVGTDNATMGDTTSGLTATGITLPSSNAYITGLGYSEVCPWAFIPDAASGGSASTRVTDYVYSRTGVRVLRVGGDYDSDGDFGVFCFYADSGAANAPASIGSRLLLIP